MEKADKETGEYVPHLEAFVLRLRSLSIAAVLLLGGCYRSSLGLRGVAGLGEVLTQGSRDLAEVELMPPIIDAYANFENAFDDAGQQPSWGMELAFKGANVLGAVVMPGQMRFVPRIDPKFNVKLTMCGSGETPGAQKALAQGLEKRSYRCVWMSGTSRSSADTLAALANRHHVPVVLDSLGAGGSNPNWEPLFARYPSVNFVLAALGAPYYTDALRQIEKYPNVYTDTSVVVDPYAGVKSASETSQKIQELLRPFAKFSNKVLFGSHWPKTVLNPAVDAVRTIFPKDGWPLVLHGNALRVFVMPLNEKEFEVASTNNGKKHNAPAGN